MKRMEGFFMDISSGLILETEISENGEYGRTMENNS